MKTHYEPAMTLRQARARYFEVNHFGQNGGYDDPWVDFKLGRVPFPFPNTPARVRAVRYHDLHHIVTGYDTDTVGEFEIAAWELAAGCRGFLAAWQLNLGGLAVGALIAPRRVFRAFVRGRHTRTLYGAPFEPLLDQTVAQVRRATAADYAPGPARPVDLALFTLAAVAGLILSALLLPLALALLPLGLLAAALRKPHPSL